MRKVKFAIKTMACLPIIFFFLSCNPLENTTRSASLLRVLEIKGTDYQGNTANYCHSDVVVVDPDTGEASWFDDPASAKLKAELLNPTAGVETSFYNDIKVTRYVVSYTRSDGKNTPGVDVPHPFEGYLFTNIPIGSEATISFVIVRHVAKMESPLKELYAVSGEVVLEVTAKVDFYGHDTANKAVKATGYISIFFANFVDE